MAKTRPANLHTSATEMTASEQRAAGMGGSYVYDPKTRKHTLAERTQAATVARRKRQDAEQGAQPDAPAPDATDA